MKKLILPAFALMILAQWAVPVKMVLDNESVLTEGTLYKFRTEPIDPSDPFRGKYVTLRFNAERFETDTNYRYKEGQEIYAHLSQDSAGYATFDSLYTEAPEELGDQFLKTTVEYAWMITSKTQVVSLALPFKKFYVEESKASDAEQAYWNAQRDSTQVAYAIIKVRKGQGVLENVMINDRPILEIVQEMNEKTENQ